MPCTPPVVSDPADVVTHTSLVNAGLRAYQKGEVA